MTILQAIILGIIQGLTEFLPISSSAHLVIAPFLFGWHIPEEQIFPFDVLVQSGTLLAVILYFRKEVWNIAIAFIKGLVNRQPFKDPDSRMGWYLILATIPAGIAGLLIKDIVEAAFKSTAATAAFLFVTAALLFSAEYLFNPHQRTLVDITWKDALWIGAAQVLSLFPGISRSGSTIAGGMIRRLDRKSAGRFSFLMSIPVVLAATLLSVLDLLKMPGLTSFLPALIAGFIVSAIVGYLAIHWLLAFITKHSLKSFAIYCILLGSITLIVFYLR
jgi:undecaprenyl-diphosphatase